jgi:hypothetical protein
MQKLAYKPGSIGLIFEGLPANCSESEAADLLWFNIPGGLNAPVENLSCKTQDNGLGSTVIAVLTLPIVQDFVQRILEQGGSKRRVNGGHGVVGGQPPVRLTCPRGLGRLSLSLSILAERDWGFCSQEFPLRTTPKTDECSLRADELPSTLWQ